MTERERRLLRFFVALSEADQEILLAFAEFLTTRRKHSSAPVPEPCPLPRPAEESVVGAIKRLAASYPMLDRSAMLNETSSLMAQHVLQGRPASAVIDELEQVFRSHYHRLKGHAED